MEWIIENGHYSPRPEIKIQDQPRVGYVNGLAVYGADLGTVMEIEVAAAKNRFGKGKLNITGIVEEEQISSYGKKIRRKSMARCSVENVMTALENIFDLNFEDYNIHINFPGGVPVDGPSAGISMATALYSAITNNYVDNKVAMTGEISLHGEVKPVGGVNSKIQAAIKAGAKKVIIPEDNWQDSFGNIKEAKIIAVKRIQQVLEMSLIKESSNSSSVHIEATGEVLYAKPLNNTVNS